jgi:hypothetical protein
LQVFAEIFAEKACQLARSAMLTGGTASPRLPDKSKFEEWWVLTYDKWYDII